MPFVEPARHVWVDRHAVSAQSQDEDREAVETVRVEVAEDHDPLGQLARPCDPGEEQVGVGQEGRVVQTRRAAPRTRRRARPRPSRRAVPATRSSGRRCLVRRRRRGDPERSRARRGSSSGSGVPARPQDAMRRSPAPPLLTPSRPAAIRAQRVGCAGHEPRRGDRDADPPRPTSPRAADWPRRSRSTSR